MAGQRLIQMVGADLRLGCEVSGSTEPASRSPPAPRLCACDAAHQPGHSSASKYCRGAGRHAIRALSFTFTSEAGHRDFCGLTSPVDAPAWERPDSISMPSDNRQREAVLPIPNRLGGAGRIACRVIRTVRSYQPRQPSQLSVRGQATCLSDRRSPVEAMRSVSSEFLSSLRWSLGVT